MRQWKSAAGLDAEGEKVLGPLGHEEAPRVLVEVAQIGQEGRTQQAVALACRTRERVEGDGTQGGRAQACSTPSSEVY